ncbi:MAG: SDR family NAD(P)-dependent oxidoreductase [Abyssibacter sp.]|uniref:SDR family NAD(P)-dependent oxidoreductase n=1 Tax=Abyssibacter sp. TaxID=2320200 RepID=UPI00321B0C15
MTKSIDAPVWLITGAGSGLGRATALQAAQSGARVVLAGRSRRRLEDTANAIADCCDAEPAVLPLNLAGAGMDDYAEVATLLDESLGRLDVIAHCAAQFTGLTPLHELKPEDMATILHVNVTAPWLLTRALLPLLGRQPSAVLWLDDADARRSNAFWGAYGLSKAALHKLQDSWQQELEATSTVRMRLFAPPPMFTALRRLAFPALEPSDLASPEDVARELTGYVQQILNGKG